MNIVDIMKKPRQTSGDYHAAAGVAWLKYGVKESLHTPFLYSAFEFRLAIERYVFEIYYLILLDELISDEVLSDEDLKKMDSFSSLIKLIHENAGNKLKLFRAFKFNSVFVRVFLPLKQSLSVPDIGKFHKFWQKLSYYCHRKLKPEDTWDSSDWIKKGYELLGEIESYLVEISVEQHYGWISKPTLSHDLQNERENFILNQEMTEEQLEKKMQLLKNSK